MKHWDMTYRVIGCAMTVHSTLGNGFPEEIYRRCMEIEMSREGISFRTEFSMPVYYRDVRVGTRQVDFLVGEWIMVELKARSRLEDIHLAQAINYLEVGNVEIGLLINFGARSLEYRRLTNRKYRSGTPADL